MTEYVLYVRVNTGAHYSDQHQYFNEEENRGASKCYNALIFHHHTLTREFLCDSCMVRMGLSREKNILLILKRYS